MKFKRFDKVIVKHNKEEGYIDAVVRDRYLVRLKEDYAWVDEWDLELQGNNKKNVEKSDVIKKMLGDI